MGYNVDVCSLREININATNYEIMKVIVNHNA